MNYGKITVTGQSSNIINPAVPLLTPVIMTAIGNLSLRNPVPEITEGIQNGEIKFKKI